jgi:hypothetical protein
MASTYIDHRVDHVKRSQPQTNGFRLSAQARKWANEDENQEHAKLEVTESGYQV